jgi:hypothetical protein
VQGSNQPPMRLFTSTAMTVENHPPRCYVLISTCYVLPASHSLIATATTRLDDPQLIMEVTCSVPICSSSTQYRWRLQISALSLITSTRLLCHRTSKSNRLRCPKHEENGCIPAQTPRSWLVSCKMRWSGNPGARSIHVTLPAHGGMAYRGAIFLALLIAVRPDTVMLTPPMSLLVPKYNSGTENGLFPELWL